MFLILIFDGDFIAFLGLSLTFFDKKPMQRGRFPHSRPLSTSGEGRNKKG
jgi:hypothetical protein